MDKGCLPYIIGIVTLAVVFGMLSQGDKGGFDSIGRVIVFGAVAVGVIALITSSGKDKN